MALVWYQRICKGFKLCSELWSSSLKIPPFVLQLPIKLQKRSALIFTLEFSVQREQYTPISFEMIRRFSQHTGNHSKHDYPFFFFQELLGLLFEVRFSVQPKEKRKKNLRSPVWYCTERELTKYYSVFPRSTWWKPAVCSRKEVAFYFHTPPPPRLWSSLYVFLLIPQRECNIHICVCSPYK